MCYFKEKPIYILIIFLFLAFFTIRPQFVHSQNGFDTDAPSINETYPASGAINVPVNSSITVPFSEFMDTDNPFTFNPFSIVPIIPGQILWELDQTLIFDPDALLGYNETYQVTIGTQATDLSGNSLENPYQWSFLTERSPWLHFSDIQGLSLDQSNVKLIFGQDNGDIWIVLSSSGSSDDLYIFNGFDPSDFSKVNESLGKINALAQDSAGNILVASEPVDNPAQGGVHVFNETGWTHHNSTTDQIFSDNTIKCLTIDSEDHVWAGSLNSGIFHFDGSSWTNYNMTNSGLSNDWVISIEADEDDYIWFTTPFGGIEGLDTDTNTWTSYTSTIETQTNISFPFIRKIVSGPERIWAASDLGLLSYDIASEQWERYTQIGEYLLDDSRLNALALDPLNGMLLVGTNDGLTTFDGVNGEPIILGNVGPNILEIAVDAYGNKWIGTNNSLSRHDTDAPLLLSYSPSNNKKDVSRNTNIVLTFSEPMDENSVIISLSTSPSVSFSSSWDPSSNKLTINPKSQLKDNKKYNVTLSTNATDIQGHPLANSYSWSFTTKKSSSSTGTTGFTSTYRYPFGSFDAFPSIGFGTFGTMPTFSSSRLGSFGNFGTMPAFSSSRLGSFGNFGIMPAFSSTGFGKIGGFNYNYPRF